MEEARMADPTRFNWGQAAFALFMFALGTGVATVLFDHSAAIAENRTRIAENRTSIVGVAKDVGHLEENSLTVDEQKDLSVTLTQLNDAVMQLQTEVKKLQGITP
jgi:hypothetical protein